MAKLLQGILDGWREILGPQDVPLFDDLTPPAERIPIATLDRAQLLAALAALSDEATALVTDRGVPVPLLGVLTRVVLVAEHARVYLGEREP